MGTGKTHTAKTIYHGLLQYYDKQIKSDLIKRKGLILAFTGKAAYNVGGVTVHSALRLSFGSTKMVPLNYNTLDLLEKEYAHLKVLLIDEVSLIWYWMFFNIDKRLREIMHNATKPFCGLDVIFYGDFFQAQWVHDSWIFENPKLHQQTFPYSFWTNNVRFYQLETVVRQNKKEFIDILYRMWTCSHTMNDIELLNQHC